MKCFLRTQPSYLGVGGHLLGGGGGFDKAFPYYSAVSNDFHSIKITALLWVLEEPNGLSILHSAYSFCGHDLIGVDLLLSVRSESETSRSS